MHHDTNELRPCSCGSQFSRPLQVARQLIQNGQTARKYLATITAQTATVATGGTQSSGLLPACCSISPPPPPRSRTTCRRHSCQWTGFKLFSGRNRGGKSTKSLQRRLRQYSRRVIGWTVYVAWPELCCNVDCGSLSSQQSALWRGITSVLLGPSLLPCVRRLAAI